MKGVLRCPMCHSYSVQWGADEMGVTQALTERLTLPAGCNDCHAEWTVYLVVADIQIDAEGDSS